MNAKALCIGINIYKHYPENTLRFCVNDARRMAAWLHDDLGLNLGNIRLLLDAQATKANIMAQLRKIKAEVEAAALAQPARTHCLFWTYSSHGTQVADQNGDETDGLDEALCCHDIAEKGQDWDPTTIIIDDELHELFMDLPANVRLEVWFDCCHAGTGLKELVPWRRKFMPLTSRQAKRFPTARRRFARLLEKQGSYGGGVLWAAAGADQTSADGYDGKPNGAFTGAFLANFRPELSRHDLVNLVKADLRRKHYDQVPRVECLDVLALKRCGE
jgi:hypothetical protein